MKKKIWRTIMALALAGTMAMGLTACGSGAVSSTAGGDTSAAQTAKETTQGANGDTGEVPVIKLWHIFGGDTDPNKEIIDQVVKDAEEKFHVKIESDTAENEAYKMKLKAAIAANETPDIFYTWGHGFIKPFVEAGKVEALDDYLTDDFKSHLGPSTLTGFQFDEKTYALTTDQSVACMFYNKEMFEKLNLEVPETFDDFLTVCQTFLDNGITPLTVGGKEPWTIAMYHDLLALRAVGSEGVKAATGKETGYDDPGFLEAAQCLKKLVDMGAFPDGSAGISREESEVPFLQGQIPMYLNGSWLPNEVKNQTPEDFKWGAFSLPQIAEGGDGAESNQYGAQCFAINKDTKYPNAAFALIQWLTSGEWDQKLADASMGVPMDNDATWPAALADAKAVLDSTTHRLNWAVGMENDTNVNAAIKTNMAMMISGSVNAQQFADAFAKIQKGS